jgi:hypothetical protein
VKKSILLTTAFILTLIACTTELAHARDNERGFRRGRGGFRGNERSERVGRIGLGNMNYGGNGCPDGTMSLSMSPDNLSFSLLFDSFTAEVGAGARRMRDVMSCQIVIPFDIPEGMQMEITRVDFRGFVAIPEGGRGALHSVFNFFDRGRGPQDRGNMRDRMNIRYQFAGPITENYEISTGVINERGAPETEVSPCGGRAFLSITNQLRVNAGRRGETASATIDSIDGSSNSVYYVNWKKCDLRRERPDFPGNGRRDDRGPGHGRGPGGSFR